MIYAPMRIFLTGATGYIGGAVLDALIKAGHDVTALVRDKEKARRVAKRGGHPVVGNLAEPESFRSAADAQDGYVLAAFDQPSNRGPQIDRGARRHDHRVGEAPAHRSGVGDVVEAIHHLHLGHLGAGTIAGSVERGRAGESHADCRVASGA